MTHPVIEELRAIGVEVTPHGENLVIRPASKVPPALKERLRAHKAEVLAALRTRPATCSSECYEVEPGVWIHRPWTGCATTQTSPARATAQPQPETCWHCGGSKRCACATCWSTGVCAACKGTGKLAWRLQ